MVVSRQIDEKRIQISDGGLVNKRDLAFVSRLKALIMMLLESDHLMPVLTQGR